MAVTLQQIANAAGVSRATVDRALKNRGRINPEVAEKIRKLADEMGYVPNISGRALAFAKRNIQIGVIMQSAETPFVQDIAKGIEQAKQQVEQFGCSLNVIRIYGMDAKRVIAYMEEMRENGVNAIALTAIEDDDLRKEIKKCNDAGIKIVTFNSDIENAERMCFIGQDAIKSGRTAGGILADIIGEEGGKIAMLSGGRTIHKNREKGLREVLEKYYKNIELTEVAYTGNRGVTAANRAEELLMTYPDLKGIYINTEGTDEIVEVIKERHLHRKMKVVVQDYTGWKSKHLIDGTIDYVIADDSYIQGYEPIMTLFNYLYHHEVPEKEYIYTAINIMSKFSV